MYGCIDVSVERLCKENSAKMTYGCMDVSVERLCKEKIDKKIEWALRAQNYK